MLTMSKRRVWGQIVEQVSEDTAVLLLTHPIKGEFRHLFSPRHMDKVNRYSWCHSTYARTNIGGNVITRLHWLVMGLEAGRGTDLNVDHINRDKLDSRDENLRVVTRRTNQHNREDNSDSYCIHVTPNSTYRVFVKFEGKHVYVPTFKTIDSARKCRSRYLEVADQMFMGLRSAPSKEELRALSVEVGV